ncbi:hypothetical protein AAEJ42_22510, partial [Shewanella algae]|uniref:hypothetical protein n=1 Tax=Shewanella algae TaxID=38313 RepID=UPI00313D6044
MFERLRLGFNVPLALFQDGETYTLPTGETLTPPTKSALGDVRLGVDARVCGSYDGPFTLAVGVQAHLPTGSTNLFTGDGKSRIVPRLMM